MSDEIKHECGLAFIRLRKPFSYYQQKFGTALYGLNKLLLMEKQHRGQDGAGIAAVKLNTEPATRSCTDPQRRSTSRSGIFFPDWKRDQRGGRNTSPKSKPPRPDETNHLNFSW